jgi:uncharacterized damage-inducible protein DinB
MEFTLERTVQILRATPVTLRALLGNLSEPWTSATDGPDTWSAFDVVGHLIHGEKTDWIARLHIILEQGESRTFEPFDRFAQFETSVGRTLDELLDEFERLRAENIEALESLDLQPAQLEATGTHPELGTVTARQLLATWATHDLGHIGQIVRTMARGYSDEVGPWGAYLRILAS